jgi:hypothetical protein
MNRRILTSLVAVCACTSVIAAQAPTQPASGPAPAATQPQTSDQRAPKPATITLEGCIQRIALAPSAVAGATGTSGSPASAFILADAVKPAAVLGATGRLPMIAPTYRLDAENSKLSPHVGHKVEVVGTVDELAGTAAGSVDQSTTGSAASAPKLKVQSVRMIASICAPSIL